MENKATGDQQQFLPNETSIKHFSLISEALALLTHTFAFLLLEHFPFAFQILVKKARNLGYLP